MATEAIQRGENGGKTMEGGTKPEYKWLSYEKKWTPSKESAFDRLAPGIYEIKSEPAKLFGGGGGIYLKELETVKDELVAPDGSLADYIAKQIEHFWKSEEKYKKAGVLHKRGILLEGAPGTGKTAICLLLGEIIAAKGGVTMFTPPNGELSHLPMVLKTVRETMENVPIVNIFEDIDKHVTKKTAYRNEGEENMNLLLSLLDGENQVNNVVHLATTNFVDKLDARLVNRPSRFDEVIRVEPPTERVRASFLAKLLPEQPGLVKELAGKSKGLNFAHLKELAVCTGIYDRPVKDTLKRLNALIENRPAGFTQEEEKDEEGN